MEIPPEQVAMLETVALMDQKMVPMPVGPTRSYTQILHGNNLCTILLLMLCGSLFLALAASPKSVVKGRVSLIVALTLIGVAIISGIYFFPVPAILTALAAALGLFAMTLKAGREVA